MNYNKKYKIKGRAGIEEISDSVIMSGDAVAKIEKPFDKKLLNIFWLFVVGMVLVLFGRVTYLTIFRGDYYNAISEKNKTRTLIVKAPRGKIYDRFGETLVYNVPSLDLIMITDSSMNQSVDKDELLQKLKQLFPKKYDELDKNFNDISGATGFVVILKDMTQREALLFLENKVNLPSLQVRKIARRNYDNGLIFSHILGYEGKIKKKELENNPNYLLTDFIGKQGLEKYYEKYLRGIPGEINLEVNSRGKVVREMDIISPKQGNDLILNIDAQLQKKIFDSLSETLEKKELKAGAAVAINPKNGEVLALISLPSYDNNLFSRGISKKDYNQLISNPNNPMFNRAIAGEYPPGSTFKPLMAVGALTEGVINEHTQIESKGGISVGNWYFGDWKVHGFTDIRKAIAVSSDVFFYSVGGGYGGIKGIGIKNIKKYSNEFGLGSPAGIDLPGEASGFIPTSEWKKKKLKEQWYIGNTYHASIGQGYVTTTPLQLADYIATIANGGTLYQPRIVSQIKKNGETIYNKAKIIRSNFINSKIIKIVQEGMRMTVTDGTAKMLNDLPVEVAGKTGTAQYGRDKKTFGWFVSYAPYDNPEIVLVVLVEGQEEHGYNAVPITKDVYEYYFSR